MEIKNMNPNPRPSKGGERQVVNNPYVPETPFTPYVSYMNGATRAMVQALPYGKNTVRQEMVNIANQQMSQGTRNQQMFGETIMSSAIPSLPRN
jgi:hypothetical protein